MHALFNDFFRSGSRISVEARSAEGNQVSPVHRRVHQFLQIASHARNAVAAGLAVGVGVAAGMAIETGMGLYQDHVVAKRLSATDLDELRSLAYQAITPRNLSLVARMEVSQARLPGRRNDGPMAYYDRNAGHCSVSLFAIDSVNTLPSKSKDAEFLVRKFVTIHEAAHCEGNHELFKAEHGNQPNMAKAVNAFLDHYSERVWDKLLAPAGMISKTGMSTLALERHADARALLHVAHEEFTHALLNKSPGQALADFNVFADMVIALRLQEEDLAREMSGYFYDHDSVQLLFRVRDVVNEVGSAPDSMVAAMNGGFLAGERVNDFAWQMVLGSLVDDQEKFIDQFARVSVFALAEAVKGFRVRTREANARVESLDFIHGEHEDVESLHAKEERFLDAIRGVADLAVSLKIIDPLPELPADMASMVSQAHDTYLTGQFKPLLPVNPVAIAPQKGPRHGYLFKTLLQAAPETSKTPRPTR